MRRLQCSARDHDEHKRCLGRLATPRRCCRRTVMTEAYTARCMRGPIGCESGNVVLGAVDLLSLAGSPTFVIMALLAGGIDNGSRDVLCATAQHGSALNGMVVMYLLMSAFHSAPWFRLLRKRASCACR